jgi:dipeptidyl aminopeptidase/acylaminoacyl peptidase
VEYQKGWAANPALQNNLERESGMKKRVSVNLLILCVLALSVLIWWFNYIKTTSSSPPTSPTESTLSGVKTSSSLNTSVGSTLSPPVLVTYPISGWAVYSSWVSQNPVESQIFLKNLDLGEITQLTYSGNNSGPIWSPDGSQIMFLSWTKDNSFDIYLMDKDGKRQRPIVASQATEIMPDWSPDGNKIIYVSNKDGNNEIYLFDLVNKTTKMLTKSQEIKASPKWSTDGKKIAFISNSGASGRTQIFVMNTDGTDITPVTEFDLFYDDSPVWCPDNSCIILTRLENGPKLMILDLSNRKVRPLLGNLFNSEKNVSEAGVARSPLRGYITFYIDETFYALDIKNREIYSLDIKAKELSLYP